MKDISSGDILSLYSLFCIIFRSIFSLSLFSSIHKSLIAEIKPYLMESAGSLQLCAGEIAGCEAAAHALREVYEEEGTDTIFLIDAPMHSIA